MFDNLSGEMSLYSGLLVLGGGGIYLFLRPAFKIWLGFFVMTSCFDLLPAVIDKKEIWDAGIMMLLLAWPQLLLKERTDRSVAELHVKIIALFITWMIICFIWSIFVYHYPLLLTIKQSRQMLLGYLSFFVLLRLFETDPSALTLFLRSFYFLVYLLLIVSVAQFFFKTKFLFGHYSELGRDTRFLPIFLPFAHFFMWHRIIEIMTVGKVKFRDILFILLTLFVTLNTITRGIYFAVFLSGLLLGWVLLIQTRLSLVRTLFYLMGGLAGVLLLLTVGVLDKFIARASTGLHLITSDSFSERKEMNDTFSGRIALTGERFQLVMEKNPLFGFGFVHEDFAHDILKLRFHYGSVVTTDKYLQRYKYVNRYTLALHSGDIGWPDIAIDTGFVGFFLFVFFLIAVFIHYMKSQKERKGEVESLRLAFLVVIFYQAVLMFNGNTYVTRVQVSCFMLAGYTYLSRIAKDRLSTVKQERMNDDVFSVAQNQHHHSFV